MSDATGAIAHGVAPRAPPPGAADVLTLTVGNQTLTGWQRISVTRPLAAIPASFSIELTEKYPNAADTPVQAGQPCTVKIGADLVLTGYVDRYTSSVSAAQHTIRVEGRSMSEDLVDCSAIVENTSAGSTPTQGLQILNGDAISIAKKLAKPYGVEVRTNFTGKLNPVPQFNINLGETVWEIIDRVTRYSKLIAYDLPDGAIMLSEVGKESMASGFKVGANVEAADVMFSMDQRYSEYEGHMISMMALGTEAGVNMPGVGEIVRDDEVAALKRKDGSPRFRKLFVISEQTDMGRPIAGERAAWEMNRRKGQSYNFSVTCDAWRDGAGKLWSPNYLAPIDAEALKLKHRDWLIGTVTYLRDEGGQHAHLSLWPKEAFSVEPTTLNYLVTQEGVNANNPTKPNADAKPPPAPGHVLLRPDQLDL
jgi:prophage tail gpP-like protein